ncbi:hypothetical protein OSB04_030493 [Centaurea solstitialis]|uniref:Ubiquitin-like protease family profile domain-containing protein n=1 Tax=Centaurea solstitialis TaxID=347529 RepID=A0AA38SKC8_9ASTR|nr:hypothetical protein OSB04_030493 [Centaurea solstitialis]
MEVITISSTPSYSRSKKTGDIHNQESVVQQIAKREEIRAGKQIKDEHEDCVTKKPRIEISPPTVVEEKPNVQGGPSQHNSNNVQIKKYSTLNTRTSPKTLYDTVRGLNQAQRKAVCDMGLESIAKMTIDGVPSKLGFYVVDILNTKDMLLEVSNGSIPISRQSIQKLMGLRSGGVDLDEQNDVHENQITTEQWKAQFDKPKIRPTDVMKQILSTNDSGIMFKMNFLVLFVNLIAECTTNGTCNINFISKIKNEDMIPHIDWCKFIYDKVRQSKQRWNRNNTYCFYAGPLTYITLLYVESTISPTVEVQQKKHAISAWNIGLLRKRQTIEIAEGGFGLLPIRHGCISSTVKQEHTAPNTPTTPPKEPGRKEYIQHVDQNMKLLVKAKYFVEKSLQAAFSKYPEDPMFLRFLKQYETVFNINRHEGGTSKHHDQPQDGASASRANVIEHPMHEVDELPMYRHPSTLTPLYYSPEFIEEIEKSTKKLIQTSKAKKKLELTEATLPTVNASTSTANTTNDDDIPKFDLGISPVKEKAADIHSPPPKPTSSTCVDNGKRVADEPNKNPKHESKRETKVGRPSSIPIRHTISRLAHNCGRQASYRMGVVKLWFNQSEDGIKITRLHLESLAAKAILTHRFLDAWACVLNYDERLRSRESPRRYFFKTNVMMDSRLRTKTTNINKQYALFRRNLAASTNNRMDIVRMKDIDLVFFPIVCSTHWYVVVFNLKKPSVVILDNKYAAPMDNDTTMHYYGNVTDVLQMLMIKHLTTVGHQAGNILDGVGQERPEMDWQTRSNFQDYGLFTMRHMECYMGNTRGWRIGIGSEGSTQDSQLADLRMKITTKLLQSGCNKKKIFVTKEMHKWFSLEEKIRIQLSAAAYETQTDRLPL